MNQNDIFNAQAYLLAAVMKINTVIEVAINSPDGWDTASDDVQMILQQMNDQINGKSGFIAAASTGEQGAVVDQVAADILSDWNHIDAKLKTVVAAWKNGDRRTYKIEKE